MKRYYVKYSVPQFAFGLGEGESTEDAMKRGAEPSSDAIIIEIEQDFSEAWEVQVAVAKKLNVLRTGASLLDYTDEDIILANVDPMWITIEFIGLL